MSHAHDSTSTQLQRHLSPSGRSSTPASAVGAQSPTASPSNTADSKPKAKPVNVFSNDGSFLQRLQRNKMEEEEKKKAKKDLERKINFEDRFKNRGKRKLSPPEDESEQSSPNSSLGNSTPGSDPSTARTTPEEPPSKRTRADEQADEYQKEMRNFENSTGGLSSNTGSKLRVK